MGSPGTESRGTVFPGTGNFSRLPGAFVPNLGQWEHPAPYVGRVGDMTVFLQEDGWTFTLEDSERGVAVRMTVEGADVPQLVPEDRLAGLHHYFLGSDPSKWHKDVPLYGAVRYRDIQPGIDLRTREQDGRFEYDLLLDATADLEAIEIAVEGIDGMHLDRDGALVMETALGPVRMPVPLTWEEDLSGIKHPIPCDYVLLGPDRFGFEVAGRTPDWSLVVDPGVVWTTQLEGNSHVHARVLARNGQGGIIVAGSTVAADFPASPGAYDTTPNGDYDVFAAELSPSGSGLVWSTFLGGTGDDTAEALAVDGQGAVTLAGSTRSMGFPTTSGAYDTTFNEGYDDGFVAQLSSSGSDLVWSTFLGGAGSDGIQALALDAQGAVTVAGGTGSSDFPMTPGAYDTTFNDKDPWDYGPGYDAFVARLSPSGSDLLWSTFLGGAEGADGASSIALDTQGAVTVAGETDSSDFPTTPGAYDSSYNEGGDVFLTRLSPDGKSLVWSTFLGGMQRERVGALSLDAGGTATVVGYTESRDFPTTPGAYDTTYNSYNDIFVTRVAASGTSLAWSTYLGGTENDFAGALLLDAPGGVTVVGTTTSPDFPTTPGASDDTLHGVSDAVIVQLSPSGASLVYSTFLGGPGGEAAGGLVRDEEDTVIVSGTVIDPVGVEASFITRFDLPIGLLPFGTGLQGSGGIVPAIGAFGESARIGSSTFKITLTGAVGGAPCLFAVSLSQTQTSLFGLTLYGDFLTPGMFQTWNLLTSGPTGWDGIGEAELAVPIPNDPTLVGFTTYWQAFVMDPGSLPVGVSHTSGLEVRVVQ